MTEQQWHKNADLGAMLHCLCEQLHLNEDAHGHRKLRLFACGLARTIWELVPDGPCKELVNISEDFAYGLADEELFQQHWRELDVELYFGSHWYELNRLRRAMRTERWASGASLLTQAANEARRAESSWLRDAGASAQVRSASTADLERRHVALLRHIFGNPFQPYPNSSEWPTAVKELASAFQSAPECGFALQDALLEAGHPELAEHFSQETEHPRGCWVLDLVMGCAGAQENA